MFSSSFSQAARLSQHSARRAFSANAATSTTFLTKNKAAGSVAATRKAWFSDPSTYPIIFIMGGAIAMVVGVGTSCLMYNPDVQINPNRRGSVVRV